MNPLVTEKSNVSANFLSGKMCRAGYEIGSVKLKCGGLHVNPEQNPQPVMGAKKAAMARCSKARGNWGFSSRLACIFSLAITPSALNLETYRLECKEITPFDNFLGCHHVLSFLAP